MLQKTTKLLVKNYTLLQVTMEKEIIEYNVPNLFINVKNLTYSPSVVTRKEHTHQAVELVKVTSGFCEFVVNNKTFRLNEGDVFLINSFVVHKLVFVNSCTLTYIQIDINSYLAQLNIYNPSYLEGFILRAFSKAYVSGKDDSELYDIIDNILKYCKNQNLTNELYAKSYILKLIAFMNKTNLINFSLLKGLKRNPKIEAITDYINKNLEEKILLSDLSKLVFLDKYSLCRLFKKQTGGTIIEYINFVRLKRAEKYLREGMSILDISIACGFSSPQYFIKVFKKHKGCTPLVYKNLL